MDRLGIRDLRGNAAAVVRRAGAGERIVITVDGRPVAQLGPLDAGSAPVTLDDLAARGQVVLAGTDDRSHPAPQPAPWPGFRLDHLLREVRGT